MGLPKSKHSYVDLFEGIIIGGSLAAAATFIFGTKKGKELQKEIVHEYKHMGRITKSLKDKIAKAVTSAKKVKQTVKSKVKKVAKKVKSKKRAVKK